MWIPSFWCGVGATIFAEVIAIIIVGIFESRKKQ